MIGLSDWNALVKTLFKTDRKSWFKAWKRESWKI